jgi:hypothetical protein
MTEERGPGVELGDEGRAALRRDLADNHGQLMPELIWRSDRELVELHASLHAKDDRDTETVILETVDRDGTTISRVTMTHKQAYALIWEQRGDPAIGGWSVWPVEA